MPRKKLVCGLPPPLRKGGARSDLTDDQLVEILRRMALTHQGDEPRLFYPLRDVAHNLKAPVSAISRAYDILKKEGILGTIRSSRTVIEGRTAGRKINVSGFIGFPVSLSCFLSLQDYRLFYLTARLESRRRGFITSLLFFSDNAGGREGLTKLVDEFDVQFLIWYLPRVSAAQTILELRDAGVRVVGIADGDSPGTFCRYEIRRQKGLTTVLQRWRANYGIERVTVVRCHPRSTRSEEMIDSAIEKAALPYDYHDIKDDDFATASSILGKNDTTGIILTGSSASLFAVRAPSAFTELLSRSRVLLPDGPIAPAYGEVTDQPVDLLLVNWPTVTRRIIHEVTTKRAFEEFDPVTFEASARFGVSLREYSRDA